VDASPDGYTLGLIIAANAVWVTLDQKLNFNYARDIAPVTGISRNPFVMVVNPSVLAKTVPEFIAYAKANPRKLNMASSGYGSILHLTGELFKMMADINMDHVPYQRAAPAITGLLSGQAQVMFTPLPIAIQQIRAGKLRALAVTSAMRSEILPDIPTATLYRATRRAAFRDLFAPKNTPAEIINRLDKEINAVLADPTLRRSLAEFGDTALPLSSADFW